MTDRESTVTEHPNLLDEHSHLPSTPVNLANFAIIKEPQ